MDRRYKECPMKSPDKEKPDTLPHLTTFDPPLQKPHTVVRIPQYSRLHPIIPRLYVPEWKTDMKNRTILLNNARVGGVPTFEHDEPLFLNKREQMEYNSETRSRVDGRYVIPRRCDLLGPELANHHARHLSSMMCRKYGNDPRFPDALENMYD